MSLLAQLNQTLEFLLAGELPIQPDPLKLIHCLDLTLLDMDAPTSALTQLQQQAKNHQVAAICVYSEHIELVRSANRPLATVVNFPRGATDLGASIQQVIHANELLVQEIDYVFPYQAYLAGNKELAIEQCQAIAQECKRLKLKLKIILETGAFTALDEIYTLCQTLIPLGCHFLKTSTGKIATGASFGAAFAILTAIRDSGQDCGIKLSGGVKTTAQAFAYARLAELICNKPIDPNWFRIGASSLLDQLLHHHREPHQ